MIKQRVKIARWPGEYVDGFEYVITTANGHGIATMNQKGLKGLANAILIKDAINAQILRKKIEDGAAKL